jgi:hypothetical protein
MELGKPIQQHHLDAVNHFFGDMLAKIKPMTAVINFENGEPVSTSGADIFAEIGGKKLPHVEPLK